MTFHHVLKMAVAMAWFEMASRTPDTTLREEYLDAMIRVCNGEE